MVNTNTPQKNESCAKTNTLSIAHWGMARGNQGLLSLLASVQNKKFELSTHANFRSFDKTTMQRQPIFFLGNLEYSAINRSSRLLWDIEQTLIAIFQWQATEQGHPWQGADITILIPETEQQKLFWALLNKLTQYFKKQQIPYPENLFLVEVNDSTSWQHLLAHSSESEQIIMAADSLLDHEVAGQYRDLATENTASGRVISEAVAWLALVPFARQGATAKGPAPSTERAKYSVTLAIDDLGESTSDALLQTTQPWLAEHYRAGDSLLLNNDVPPFLEPLNRLTYLSKYCFRPSTAPVEHPLSAEKRNSGKFLSLADKKASDEFEHALDNAEMVEHNLQNNSLHPYLGDCGIAKTLASLVLTLEYLCGTEPDVEHALIYQETDKEACLYLINKTGCVGHLIKESDQHGK